MPKNNLEKLQISAYDKEGPSGKLVKKFMVLINPEKISEEYRIKYADRQAGGTTTPTLKFQHIPSSQINFTLIFDGTGLVKTARKDIRKKSVPEQIRAFKATALEYHGDIHKPYFLQLTWGTSLFEGYLTNLSVQYKLFEPNGTPIRAEAKVTFKTSAAAKVARRGKNAQSPDMTHIRMVRANDRLPDMCNGIYDGINYFVQVAKFNQLNQLRKLKVGSTLNFPPLVVK